MTFSLILFIRWVKLNQIQSSNGPNPCPPTVSKMIDGRSSKGSFQQSHILVLYDCEAPSITILPEIEGVEFIPAVETFVLVVPLTSNASLRSPPTSLA
jgi:hypothetical protein